MNRRMIAITIYMFARQQCSGELEAIFLQENALDSRRSEPGPQMMSVRKHETLTDRRASSGLPLSCNSAIPPFQADHQFQGPLPSSSLVERPYYLPKALAFCETNDGALEAVGIISDGIASWQVLSHADGTSIWATAKV